MGVVGGDVSFCLRRQIAFPFGHLTPIVFIRRKKQSSLNLSDFIYNCGIKVLFLGNFMTIENMVVTHAKLNPRANESHKHTIK